MLARAVILFGCFALATGVITRAQRSEPVPIRAPLSDFPMQMPGWSGVQEPPFEPNILRILGVDDYLTRAYFTSPRVGVGLYIGYYKSQRQGDTMHSPLNCLPGAGWEPIRQTFTSVPVTRGEGMPPQDIVINRLLIQKGLDKQLVLYWYQAHGRVVASEYWSKFYLVRDAVRLNRTDGAMVRVISPILGESSEDEARAEGVGVGFVQALFPKLTQFLPE